MTTHCHAATALLTREYQSDYRRQSLNPVATCVSPQIVLSQKGLSPPLDKSFHIRGQDEPDLCGETDVRLSGSRPLPLEAGPRPSSEAEIGIQRQRPAMEHQPTLAEVSEYSWGRPT